MKVRSPGPMKYDGPAMESKKQEMVDSTRPGFAHRALQLASAVAENEALSESKCPVNCAALLVVGASRVLEV